MVGCLREKREGKEAKRGHKSCHTPGHDFYLTRAFAEKEGRCPELNSGRKISCYPVAHRLRWRGKESEKSRKYERGLEKFSSRVFTPPGHFS